MASYPPDHHLLRDLGTRSEWVNEDECIFTAPVVPEVSTASGEMALGPLFAVADVALVSTAIGFSEDDWCGTLDLALRMRELPSAGPLVIACQVMRVGGTLITIKGEVFDGEGSETGGKLAGTAIATVRRMPRNDEFNAGGPEPKQIGVPRYWARETSGFITSVNDTLGLVEIVPGVLELEKSGYVTNSFGTINGGTSGIMICAGAESALGHEFTAIDVEVRYIGQAAEGPVRTVSEIVRVGHDHAVVDVTVIDMSRERRPIATGGVTLTKGATD